MAHSSCWHKCEQRDEEEQLQLQLTTEAAALKREIAADQLFEEEMRATIEQEAQRQARLETECSELKAHELIHPVFRALYLLSLGSASSDSCPTND